ncbi:MAG: hypothetical protein H8E90_01465 [Anaerolineales bacterium]|nr:hypothetical protein [Anaerolineales bacterium]
MLGNKFTVAFNYHGALSANPTATFELDKPAILTHVSFGCSSATAATINLGDSGDPNGIIAAGAIGQSGTPAEFEPADFNGALCDQVAGHHFPSDDKIVTFTITHASAEDVCLVLTFYEG